MNDMRTLDQIYWNCLCDTECHCKNLEQALEIHPGLRELRDGPTGLYSQGSTTQMEAPRTEVFTRPEEFEVLAELEPLIKRWAKRATSRRGHLTSSQEVEQAIGKLWLLNAEETRPQREEALIKELEEKWPKP